MGMKPETIPFNVEWDGIKFSGTLTPSGEKLPFGVHVGFKVRILGKTAMDISIYDGEWIMPEAPQEFANALGKWIESYYK
jgi:hypothetical protein